MATASDYRTGRHVVHKLNVHLVFTPKYRKKCITKRVFTILEESFKTVCEDFECTLGEVGYENDHVHLLVSYPPKIALSNLVNSLKGVSARLLRSAGLPEIERALSGKAFWSPSYCAVSCGGAPLETVKAYVDKQKGDSSPT